MKQLFLKRVLALLLLPVFTIAARACLWDNDTLEAEAKGIPDTIAVITGRFERNPDLFYEMRLQRVTAQLASTPEKLELYDDAGVACDRLHRGDEAIAWMQKKDAQTKKLSAAFSAGVLREQRYRYLANLGTFVAHRWLRNGANRSQISEMKRARSLIAAAIKLNPDAHFGREKYQLKAMDWIIVSPKIKENEFPDFLGLHAHGSYNENLLPKLGYADAVKGISGLIVLGDAWQSVDIFYALKLALTLQQDVSVAYLAQFRTIELIQAGKSSLLPGAPTGENFIKEIAPGGRLALDMVNTPKYPKSYEIEDIFKKLRTEADDWHAQRTAFMMERLKAGRHPDTDKTFWNEWKEPPAPSLHVPSPQEKRARRQQYLNVGMAAFGVVLVVLWILRFAKKSRKAGD